MKKTEKEELNDEQKKRLGRIRLVIQITFIVLILAVCIYAIIVLYPIFMRIQNDETYRNEILVKIQSFGSWSWVILTLIQILQTILAIIPAGPVVILTGMLYPPVVAVILCLVGQTLGAVAVIFLVKIFGYSFISLFVNPDKSRKFKLLDDSKKCGVLMFSYLLIPFLPKDPIAFIVPFTKLKVRYFIPINIIARTPMTIVSVLFGNSIISGNFGVGFIIGCCSAAVALLCFIFNRKIVLLLDYITTKLKKKNAD